MKLTNGQSRMVRAIQDLTARGQAPTLQELADYLGVRSSNSVRQHLVSLQLKGLLKPRPYGSHRTIALVAMEERAA